MQISQAKAILLQQQTEWSKVMAEDAVRSEYIKYGAMLIVISSLATFLEHAFLFSGIFYFSTTYWVAMAVVQTALAIGALYLTPMILGAIAPSFGGQNNVVNATKIYVFSMTPAWIGSTLGGIPVLGWLVALAGLVYGVVLFWQHFAEAMSIPQEKKVGYAVVSIIAILAMYWVIAMIAAGIAASFFVTSVVTSPFRL